MARIRRHLKDASLTKGLLPTLPPWAGELSLRGQVLVAGWATGVASLRRCQKLSPCLREPVPEGSRQIRCWPRLSPQATKTEPLEKLKNGEKKPK